MASASFRDSMKSLGWSRRDEDMPVSTNASASMPILAKIQNLNPFGDRGYVRLPTTEEGPGAPLPMPNRRAEEEAWFALSRWDRLLVFGGLNLAALALFVICFTLMPILALKPSKFAVLWSVASVLFLASWAVMMGPVAYFQHLASGPRLPFSATYFGSIVLTLYAALGLRSLPLTIFAAVLQLAALVWYLVSYFPMGSTGLRFATRFGTNQVVSWMNG